MAEIRQWIVAESAGQYFFYMFPAALLALFIWFKGRRVRFLIPALLITIVIVNPLFYKKWQDLGLYAYWRILWIIPVIPVLASFIPSITERISSGADVSVESKKNILIKTLLTAAGIGVVVLGGTYIYHGEGGEFTRAGNNAKLPGDVVAVANRLLELDEHPRIIIDQGASFFIRQYSGDIDTLYGRDLYGYILKAGDAAQTVHSAVREGDWETVNQEMVDDEFDYLVTKNEVAEGFDLVDMVGQFGIYRATGKPNVIKERNELGQVISITTVDENGKPINGDGKYATVSYEYDEYGRIIREFHTDTDGNGVANLQGVAGYEREYDERSHVISEKKLGPDGTPATCSAGYVEVSRVYQDADRIQESYLGDDGKPVNRIDTCYASVKMGYDEEHNRISEQYFDKYGRAVRASSGYAAVKRTYNDQGRITEEAYFDENGTAVTIASGIAEKKREYDIFGNITSESYFDANGLPTECIQGYAKVEREYDEENNVIMERFLDSDDHLVITGSGYAEVHRMYQGQHLTREAYWGADGKELLQPAGYCAIEQVWNDDDLYARIYLGSDGFPVNRTDGYAKAVWEPGETCSEVKFYSADGSEVDNTGLNLVKDVKGDENGWSDWMMPNYNILNSCQRIGTVNLGAKDENDIFSCYVEIEFKDVSVTDGEIFRFGAQGAQDNSWRAGNVWNGTLARWNTPPEDGVYVFTSTNTVSGEMTEVSTFNLDFRCDYWASGVYRIRNVKIGKGETVGELSSGV